MLSGPRGAAVGEFLASVEHEALLVGAVVNGELRELTYPIRIESKVQPVAMDSADGARIYRRSLTFLLEKAFTDLFPDGTLYVDHSVASGGYYCQVSGREPLTESEIEALKSHMQKLIEADLPFERKEVPLREAIEYFRAWVRRQSLAVEISQKGLPDPVPPRRPHGLSPRLHGAVHGLFARVRP